MKTMNRLALVAATAITALSLTACAGMSDREKNTVIGAGGGAVAGAILTGGSSLGTVGGAAVGGYIGNQVIKPRR